MVGSGGAKASLSRQPQSTAQPSLTSEWQLSRQPGTLVRQDSTILFCQVQPPEIRHSGSAPRWLRAKLRLSMRVQGHAVGPARARALSRKLKTPALTVCPGATPQFPTMREGT